MADSEDKLESLPCATESTSTHEDSCRTLPEEAFNHFLQGKRHMLVQDYSSAVTSLGIACEHYVNHFGELAIECGEVYFLYGKALFRYCQEQSGVLGGALNEGSNEDDENSSDEGKENESDTNASEEEEEEEEEEGEEPQEQEKEPSESTDSPQGLNDVAGECVTPADKLPDKQSSKEQQDSQCENEYAATTAADAVPGTSKELEEKDAEEEDIGIAWNSLETAKSIFQKQGSDNKEAQLKVAEILQILAEISMESDNNTAALQDLKECLAIQKQYLTADDRILAETYYQMGLAYVLDKQYYEGVENFKTTKDIIELRIKNLKMLPVPEKFNFEADPSTEISNLEGLLPDIKERIEDTEELIRNAKKELEEAFEKAGEVSSSSNKASTSNGDSKPISNITHLLKRKKPEQDNEQEIETKKRLKLSTCVPNGDLNMLPDSTSGTNV